MYTATGTYKKAQYFFGDVLEKTGIAEKKRGNAHTFGFNGKENDNEVRGEGNSLDFGARIYDPRLGRWMSVDHLHAKYAGLSPYNLVINNPIMFVDPDGKEVKPADANAIAVIRSTLPCDAQEYVVINPETGYIDKTRLSQYNNSGNSSNFNSLLSLANHKEIIEVSLVNGGYELKPSIINGKEVPFYTNYPETRPLSFDEEVLGFNGEPSYNTTTSEGADGSLGSSYDKDQTKSGNIEVVVNNNLSPKGKIEVMAHELFGHTTATLLPDLNINPGHNITGNGEQNIELKGLIKKSVDEAISNYEGCEE